MTSQMTCAEWWRSSGRHRSSGDSTASLSLFRSAPRVSAGYQGRLSVCDCCRDRWPIWTVDPMAVPKSTVQRTPVTTSRKRLYLAAAIANIIYTIGGSLMIWNSQAKWTTPTENSWLGSLTYLGATIGPLLGGTIVDSLGRKPTILVITSVYLLSWAVITGTRNIWALYAIRFVGGCALGTMYAAMPAYLAEISDDDVRNSVGALNQLYAGLGLLATYAAGLDICYIALALVFVFAATFSFLPESPYLLISKGKRDEAIRSLCWFRSAKAPQVEKEATAIEESLEETRAHAGQSWKLLMRPGSRKALAVAMWAMLCQQVSGVNPIFMNVQIILNDATHSISSYLSSIIVASFTVGSSLFAAPIVRWFGLKPVLISTGYAMSISLFVLSGFFFMKNTGHDVAGVAWLPLLFITIFNFAFCVGVAPLAWAAVAELLPGPLMRPSSIIIGVWVWTLAFAIMLSYQPMEDAIGQQGVFLAYGIAEGISITILAFILPDTRGLSLQEIQDLFDKSKKSTSSETSNS